MKLAELQEELFLLRRCKGSLVILGYSKEKLERIRRNARDKKNDKRLSPESYGNMCEIDYKCSELISRI